MKEIAPPRRMVEHALLLIGRVHKASPEAASAARRELMDWHATDAVHAAAIEAAQRLWDSTDGSGFKDSVALPRSQADARRARRSFIGNVLGFGGVAAAVGVAGRWYWQQAVYRLALGTNRGQMLNHRLPDGSELDVAALTRGAVSYFRDRREIRLDSGEIRFQVSTDAQRPFTVTTAWGRVQVLGTTFSVSARDGHMRVAVAEGRVAVWPSRGAGLAAEDRTDSPAITLGAGEAIECDAQGLGALMSVRAADVGAWRHGWLVFDNTRLPEAIARWNDYLQQPLSLGTAPGLQALRLSGSFPLRNPQAFLNGLPDILPVRVQRDPGGAVTVLLK